MDASFSGRSSDPSSSRAVWKEFQQLLDKSSHAFNRLRDIPAYGGYNWEEHFHKAFHVYSQLWKFQQDHRCEQPSGRTSLLLQRSCVQEQQGAMLHLLQEATLLACEPGTHQLVQHWPASQAKLQPAATTT